jgi:hypothetical protein
MLPGIVGTLDQINNLRHSMFANSFMQHGRMILSI